MNTQIGISLGSLVLGWGAVILLALLAFRVVASLLNGLIGRSPKTHSRTSGERSGTLLAMVVAIGITVLVTAGMFRLHAVRSTPAISTVVVQTGNADELIIRDFSDARQKMQIAVHDPSVEIPLELPRINIDSATLVGNEAAKVLVVAATAPDEVPPVSAGPLTVPSIVPEVLSSGEVSQAESVSSEGATSENGKAATPLDSAVESAVLSEPASIVLPAPAESPVATSPAIAVDAPTAEESVEERRKRLSELATHLGPLIRSLLRDGEETEPVLEGDTPAAAESADRNIVVFQLPGPLRKTYAWIQLTPAVEAAVSPVKPLIDNGGLEAMANSLAKLLNRPAEDRLAIPVTVLQGPLAGEATGLAEPLLSQAQPEWVTRPDGGRKVAKTAAIFEGEEENGPLLDAINQSLNEHVADVAESLGPAFQSQAKRLKVKLDAKSAQRCVVTSYERHERMETLTEGSKPLKFIYALLEFPEDVDKVAVQKLRQAMQTERALGLAMSVGLGWLAVCGIGCGVRMWSGGSFVQRTLALPVFGVIALPLLLVATGVVIGLSKGREMNLPWIEAPKTISIPLDGDI